MGTRGRPKESDPEPDRDLGARGGGASKTKRSDKRYESAAARLTLTPLSHRSLLALVCATKDGWVGGKLMPVRGGLEANAGRRAVEDLAKFYGRRTHVFDANAKTTPDDLLLCLRKTLEAGAVTELRNFDRLESNVLITFSDWLGLVRAALLDDQPTRRISKHNFRLSGAYRGSDRRAPVSPSAPSAGRARDALARVGDIILGPDSHLYADGDASLLRAGSAAPPEPVLALFATPSPDACAWDADVAGPFLAFRETLRPVLYTEPAPLRMAELLLLKAGLSTDASPGVVREAQRLQPVWKTTLERGRPYDIFSEPL